MRISPPLPAVISMLSSESSPINPLVLAASRDHLEPYLTFRQAQSARVVDRMVLALLLATHCCMFRTRGLVEFQFLHVASADLEPWLRLMLLLEESSWSHGTKCLARLCDLASVPTPRG